MARYSTADGVRGIVCDDGYGWLPFDGAWRRNDEDGAGFTLEKRRRNPRDGTTDTGWYLYSDEANGFFGEWCGTRILEAADEANRLIGRLDQRQH